MTIQEYTTYDPREILPLYESVGWIAYTKDPERLNAGFAHSLLTLAAYEGDQLIGILRAVGDGETVVLIQDLLIHPDHQRRGYGKALLQEALARFSPVRQIQLLTDNTPQTVAFYEKLGLRRADSFGCVCFVKI